MKITFTPLGAEHIGLILAWLREPHVREYWTESDLDDEVREKFLKKLRDRNIDPYVISVDDCFIGYIQSYEACRIGGGWWPDAHPGLYGIDQFIGDPSLIGKGVGPAVISRFIEEISEKSLVREIIVDPDPTNLRAIRAFEKAGFTKKEEVVTPNGNALLMSMKIKQSKNLGFGIAWLIKKAGTTRL